MRLSAFALCNLQFYIFAEHGGHRGVSMGHLVSHEHAQIKTGLS